MRVYQGVEVVVRWKGFSKSHQDMSSQLEVQHPVGVEEGHPAGEVGMQWVVSEAEVAVVVDSDSLRELRQVLSPQHVRSRLVTLAP